MTPVIFSESQIQAEIEERKRAERIKALEKYGPEAVQPGGRPEFDILDYLINEVIGLDRYGEMVINRFAGDEDLVLLGHALQRVSYNFSPALIRHRRRLMTEGQHLGSVEQR